MKKTLYFIFILILLSNCTLKNITNHHGVHFLDKKEKQLIINKTNRNEIFELLGYPVTKSSFDNDLYIYIERKTSGTKLIRLGKKKLLVNNALLLEVDDRGILLKKNFYDMNSMNKIDFDKSYTDADYSKKSFIYSFLSSLRNKIDDPLGKKRKKINSR